MSHLQAVPASPPSMPSEAASAQRHHNEGHGRRLTAAFEALEAFPALAESRNRVLRLFTQERTSPAEIVAAVESDVALAIAVIRLANQADGKTKGKVESVVKAVEVLSPEAVPAQAALVRLADMLAHYGQGEAISPAELLKTARQIEISPPSLRRVMYELPYPQNGRQRQIDPCPLSDRELEVLKRLATGKVYKQIASELSLSTSTVRTHLHNIYGKLGAVDRAQAVLVATERGWI